MLLIDIKMSLIRPVSIIVGFWTFLFYLKKKATILTSPLEYFRNLNILKLSKLESYNLEFLSKTSFLPVMKELFV